MVDLDTDPDNQRSGLHRELEKSEISKSEHAVHRVIDAVNNFLNPFTTSDKYRLYCFASGASVPLDAEMDVLQADDIGKTAKKTFIDRLKNGDAGSFFDLIKKKKLQSMEMCNKKITLTSSQGKVKHHDKCLTEKRRLIE